MRRNICTRTLLHVTLTYHAETVPQSSLFFFFHLFPTYNTLQYTQHFIPRTGYIHISLHVLPISKHTYHICRNWNAARSASVRRQALARSFVRARRKKGNTERMTDDGDKSSRLP